MSKHLDVELNKIKKEILSLAAFVKTVVNDSIDALANRNKEKALEVLQSDIQIDKREVALEEEVLKVLALHQPVAIDLRFLIGVLKMNNDIERIGDLAVNIAERALYIIKEDTRNTKPPFDYLSMAAKTCYMLDCVVEAMFDSDTEAAREIIKKDAEIDSLNKEMYEKVFKKIEETPQSVAVFMNYLSAIRHLERIADYCTNIAEDVIYMVEGTIVRHDPFLDYPDEKKSMP